MLCTFTKKTHPRYRSTSNEVKDLFSCARKLVNHFWPRKNGCGVFAVLEVGKSNNLHIHMLIYGHYVDQRKLSAVLVRL